MDSIGKRIIEKRKEFNMTQDELAQKLQISRSALSLYELDRREPNVETLIKLADFFSISSDYLLGISYSGNESPEKYSYPELTKEETKLLDTFRSLNNDNRIRATARLLDLQQEQSFAHVRQGLDK